MSQSTQPEQPLQKGQSPAADAVGPPFATGTSEGSPTANAAERATGAGEVGAVHPSEAAAGVLVPVVGLEPTDAAHPSKAAPDTGAANAAGQSPAANAAEPPPASPATVTPQPAQSAPLAQTTPPPLTFPASTMLWTPSTRSTPRCSSSSALRRPARPSSAPWEPATSSMPPL